MPFGLVYAALFFGVLCTWLGLEFLVASPPLARVAGLLLILLGSALAASLLMRRAWARWAGVACALGACKMV